MTALIIIGAVIVVVAGRAIQLHLRYRRGGYQTDYIDEHKDGF